jgi:hypothetical protein
MLLLSLASSSLLVYTAAWKPLRNILKVAIYFLYLIDLLLLFLETNYYGRGERNFRKPITNLLNYKTKSKRFLLSLMVFTNFL